MANVILLWSDSLLRIKITSKDSGRFFLIFSVLAHSHITPAVSAMDQALLTKHQVKGLSIGQVLFFCVLIDRDEVEVNKNAKTNKVNIHLS